VCPCSEGCQDVRFSEEVCSEEKAFQDSRGGWEAHECKNFSQKEIGMKGMKSYGGMKKKKKKTKKK